MIVDRRRIDRLSLRVGRAADASRAADTIRQALRVAAMPGDGHPGQLFIRRLDLGTIRLADGPNPIARWMTTYLRTLRVSAVLIADARSPSADVVIARDPIEPLVVALAHAAAGRRLTAWYWPRVHAQLTDRRTPSEIAAIVWSLLAARRDAVACVPAVVRTVLEGERAAEVLAAIDPIVGAQLARAIEVTPMPAAVAAAIVETIVPPRWHRAMREVIGKWAGDMRTAWLVIAAVRAAHPRISSARVAAIARGVIAMPRREPGEPPQVALPIAEPSPARPDAELIAASRDAPRQPPESGDEPIPQRAAAAIAPAQAVAPESAAAESSAPAQPIAAPEATPREPAQPLEPERDAQPRWTLLERPQPTHYGGLYFVLRPLARLGFDAFLAEHPELDELDLGVRLLAHIADAQGIAADDPIRIALDLPPLDAPGLDPLHDAIEVWCAAVAAWLDRHAELDLTTVVRRDAAVLCSRTHLDVIFDMESSDVRIRKVALDIDPGWVPWLGRVVQFHYVYGGMLDA